MATLKRDPVTLIIAGVGGQGNILISKLIGEALLIEDYWVAIGDTYGASQRGGSVASHVRISKKAQYGAITPSGKADIILGLEPMESLRILGIYGNPETFVITNTRPIYPMAVLAEEAEYPDLEILKQAITELSKTAWFIDASDLATRLGIPLLANMVMMGSLVGTGLLPLKRETCEQRLMDIFGEENLTLNMNAFAMGFAQISS